MSSNPKRGVRVKLDSDSDSSDDKDKQYDFKRKRRRDEMDSNVIVYDVKHNTTSVSNGMVGNVSGCRSNNNNRLSVEERRRKFEIANGYNRPTEKQVVIQTKSPLISNEQRIKQPIDILTKNKVNLNGVHHEDVNVPEEKLADDVAEGITKALKEWKWTCQNLKIEEDVTWIPPKVTSPLDAATLNCWMKIGVKQLSTKADHHFCRPRLLETLFELKSLLGKMRDADIKVARCRSNPYESLKNGVFLNRAAMKMANIDAILGFALTEPKTHAGDLVLGPNDLLYFADICSGPGGFTEYVLWRKKWDAKGFGFTLKGELDFKFTEFFSGPPESFEAYYGPANDGNVYNPNNFRGFVKHVLSNSEGRGVHFLMADGGFSVRGQENQQETLSQHICLSQVLFGIGLVRAGGHFVCKMFDTFTSFTVGLIYLLHHCFDLVSIIKPITSRPANSERYIVCKWKRERDNIMPILEYLAKCHEIMWDECNKRTADTVIEVVPTDVMKNDMPFFQYIFESNNTLASRQIENLRRIFAVSRDPQLKTENEEEMKSKCLDIWKLPTSIKKMLSIGPGSRFKNFSGSYDEGFVNKGETELTLDMVKSTFKSPYDWRCVVVEGGKNANHRGFYLSLGGSKNYLYRTNEWLKVDAPFSMCKDTLVYGEIVREIANHGTNVVPVFHIIDGMLLGGKDIRYLHYTQRHEMCVKFAKAMHSSASTMTVSVKNPIRMENIGDLIEGLKFKFIKDSGAGTSSSSLVAPTDHTDETSTVIKPAGLLMLKITKDPWLMSCSRSARRKYWFNTVSGDSTFEVVEGAIADFLFTMDNRILWLWDKNMKLSTKCPSSNEMAKSPGVEKPIIHVHHIIEHIKSVIPHK